jgi:hypothetical protein
MLGLIADQFVRVYHPVSCPSGSIIDDGTVRTCANQQGANLADTIHNPQNPTFTDPTIHAAVLALNHSFIVQNFNNGAQLGTLTVYGAIGQKWRGPVALSGATGYVKSYNYDPRLQYEGPPNFIDPVTKPWRLKALAQITNPVRCQPPSVISTCVPS